MSTMMPRKWPDLETILVPVGLVLTRYGLDSMRTGDGTKQKQVAEPGLGRSVKTS